MFAPPDSPDRVSRCEEFFGLKAQPFSLTPDLRFVYQSRSHSHAFEQVTEALSRREGLIVITGEIGTGKTVLCRALLEGFHEKRTFLSVILDPLLGVDDLLHQVLADFGLIEKGARPNHGPVPEATRHQLVSTLQHFLASLIPLNAHAVIMIDEAQHLAAPVLEQIRLLSNFETDRAKLLQIVLVGQPNLDALLRQPEMRQLEQRIARRITLHPLSEVEVQDYIERRLNVAAAPTVPFTRAAMATVHAISQGTPRLINTICDRALEIGCERQSRSLDSDVVIAAAERLKLPVPAGSSVPAPLKTANARAVSPPVAAAIVALILLIGFWLWSNRTPPASPAAPAPAPAAQAPRQAPPPATPAAPSATTTPAGAPAAGAPGAGAPPAAASPAAALPAAATGDAGYRIAVAAFKTQKRAADVTAEIAAKGLPVVTKTDAGGQWYQVVVGPFATAEAAADAQRTLAREGYADTRMVSPDR